LGILAPGLLFINRRASKRDRVLGELIFTLWLLALGSVLPLVAEHGAAKLQSGPIIAIQILSGAGLAALVAQYMGIIKKKLWLAASAVALAAPILLAWANRPYLIFGKLNLASAFGAQAFAPVVLVGFAVCFPLIAFGFWLFAKLLKVR